VNAMLLNEFLKEHRQVGEREATIIQLKATVAQQRKDFQSTAARQEKDFQFKLAEQQKQIKALASGLEKVSAQLATASPSRGGLEASKFATGRIRRGGPAPQMALNNQ